jgi:urease accessory protein
MTGISSQLALLQYGDSFFPSGSVSFSWGLEGLVESGAVSGPESFRSFMTGQLQSRWACYERSVVTAAHGAHHDPAAVTAIDQTVEITTLAAELRKASCRMGSAMLLVFARLGHERAASYRGLISREEAFGHLNVMQGMLWAVAGLELDDAVALSAHTFCTGLLSAGVRLGCITHLDAQKLLSFSREEASRLARQPAPPIDSIRTHAPQAEIAVMQHALRDLRLFAN